MNLQSNVYDHFKSVFDSYDMKGSWVTDESILAKITSLCPDLTGCKVIDVGSGTGKVITKICETFPNIHKAYALDFSEAMLSKISNPLISKCISDVCAIPFGNQYFDVALTRQCLHYVEKLDQAISEIRRVLDQNGIFIFAQIVPFDESTVEYWRKIAEIRQPLRVHAFSANEWISRIENNGFRLLDCHSCTTSNRVSDWVASKKITDINRIEEYRKLFLNASKHYKQNYNIVEKNADIFFSSNWIICSFRVR